MAYEAGSGCGGHTDDRARGEALFQIVISGLAVGQTEPPAIVMEHNADMIRVVEGSGGPLERTSIAGKQAVR